MRHVELLQHTDPPQTGNQENQKPETRSSSDDHIWNGLISRVLVTSRTKGQSSGRRALRSSAHRQSETGPLILVQLRNFIFRSHKQTVSVRLSDPDPPQPGDYVHDAGQHLEIKTHVPVF